MKKVILSATCFTFIVMAFMSCEKEEVKMNQDSNVSEVTVVEAKSEVGPLDKASNLRIWFDYGDPDGVDGLSFGCVSTGGSCLPDVIVTPGVKSDVRGVGNAILNGSTDQIKDKFKEKKQILKEIIEPQHLQGVIAGGLSVSVKGMNNLDGSFYMIFKNKPENHIIAVYPMK